MPVLICDRTSHSPVASFRMSGIPRGQPNWDVLMSSPTAFRSSRTSPSSHSRTGSLPISVRKNTTSKIGRRRSCSWPACAIKQVYHHWYTEGNVAFGGCWDGSGPRATSYGSLRTSRCVGFCVAFLRNPAFPRRIRRLVRVLLGELSWHRQAYVGTVPLSSPSALVNAGRKVQRTNVQRCRSGESRRSRDFPLPRARHEECMQTWRSGPRFAAEC